MTCALKSLLQLGDKPEALHHTPTPRVPAAPGPKGRQSPAKGPAPAEAYAGGASLHMVAFLIKIAARWQCPAHAFYPNGGAASPPAQESAERQAA